MKKLNKMLLREIIKSKGQYIAATAIVFIGVTVFLAAYMSFKNLKSSADYFYDNYNLLDYYASAKNIPIGKIDEIKKTEGIRSATGRISQDISADMGNDKRVTLRLVSVPDNVPPEINKLYFDSGSYFTEDIQNGCFLNQQFAEFYNLQIGDSVKTVINNERLDFTVKGIVSSPEFVNAAKTELSLANDGSFGIIYIKESYASRILGFNSSYNQVHIQFKHGINTNKVIGEIESKLKANGFIEGVERSKLISCFLLDNDIQQLQQLAVVFPFLFLFVATIIIYVSQRRIISSQRTLIGMMKAFGYSNGRILMHYILHSLIIAIVGGILAVVAGTVLGKVWTGTYTMLYNLPVMNNKIYWDVVLIGCGLCTGFTLLGGYSAAKRVLKIRPAQAMRAEVPKIGKRVFLERIGFIWKRLPFGWKVSIRNVFRSKSRSASTGIATVFTVMIFIIVFFMLDSVNYVLDFHFKDFQRQDYKVNFSTPLSYQTMENILRIKGIEKAEPMLEVPIQIIKDGKTDNSLLVGLAKDNSMYNFKNTSGQKLGLSREGILVSRLTAKRLSIGIGDTVDVSSPMGIDGGKSIKVTGIVNQCIGDNCYMDIDEIFKASPSSKTVTAALIKTSQRMDQAITKELYKNPAIGSLESRMSGYDSIQDLMGIIYIFMFSMIAVGSIMGFSTVYNTTVINISSRRRELASLKVMGYKRNEIEWTILRENMIICALAIIPGLLLGRILSEGMAQQFNNQNMILDVIIAPRTYLITIASVFVFTYLAQLTNRRSISGLDMVEVLKDREG